MFCPEHPKWDQNPKFTPVRETTSIPAPVKWESPQATCPDHCYKVPESHEAVGFPGHCSFSCGTGCPDHCCSLPTVSTLPICPSECHASCHELCPMHCCKVSSFSVSLCPSHCKDCVWSVSQSLLFTTANTSHCPDATDMQSSLSVTLRPFIRGKISRELHHLYKHVLSKTKTAHISGLRLISVLDSFLCDCCP